MSKILKVVLITAILLTVVSIAFTIAIIEKSTTFVEEVREKYNSKLGYSIVVDKDTLEIIDFSVLEERFILKDGTYVTQERVFNEVNLIKK